MATLYDELGVPRHADTEELRNAYRREARRRHPDLHPGREQEAQESMRRLNAAWAILGNDETRRAYDASINHGFAPPADELTAPEVLPQMHGVRLRLWPLVLLVLLVIFVFTAYATQNSDPSPPRSNTTSLRCVSSLPGVDYVSCDQPNVGHLVQEVSSPESCPPGTFRHVLAATQRVACVRR